MAVSENKKRINVTLDLEELEILESVSKHNRRTNSNTISLLIDRYLKDEYSKIKEDTSK